MRKVSENVMGHIQEQMESVDFGTITIELRGPDRPMDIKTERTKRFEPGAPEKTGKVRVVKKG